MNDVIVRFLVGGLVVSAFAAVAGLFKPMTFSGLFGAAPSVALATLALTISRDGKDYASTECRSMTAGAAGLCLYSILVSQLLSKLRLSALQAHAFCAAPMVSGRFYSVAILLTVEIISLVVRNDNPNRSVGTEANEVA